MRRVLLVSYDFPPAAGSGAYRVAKFAKYLPTHGWQPVVLTTRHGRWGPVDPTLLAGLEGVEIHRTRVADPYRLFAATRRALQSPKAANSGRLHGGNLSRWHPAAWLVPDAKLAWIPFAVAWGLTRRPRRRCEIVLSTIPTPTAAILGSLIAKLWGVPHIVDYRDPWSGAFFLPQRVKPLQRLERAWERRILEDASAAVITPGVKEKLPSVATPLRLIPNGYDEDDFKGARPRRPGSGFVIAHTGLLYKERDLAPLLNAVRLLDERNAGSAQRLHFLQVGRTDAHVADQLEQLSEKVQVTAIPTVPHAEAIAYMLGADLLYLPTNDDLLPGKTYEYLRSGTPILGLASQSSSLGPLLAETAGGQAFAPADWEKIATYLEERLRGGPARPGPARAVERYSRRAATHALARLLEEVAASGDGATAGSGAEGSDRPFGQEPLA